MASKFFIIFTAVISACICRGLHAQPKRDSFNRCFETFTIKNGLSQGMVRGVLHDKEGFMWFGTKDGLNKYDGYHVTVYRNDPSDRHSLPDNYITQLSEDERGNFWIGTSTRGVCLLDRKNEIFYTVQPDSAADSGADKGIHELICQDGKLYIYESYNVSIYDISNIVPANYGKTNTISLRKIADYFRIRELFRPSHPLNGEEMVSVLPDNSLWACYSDTFFVLTPSSDFQHWHITAHSPSEFGIGKDIHCIVAQVKQNDYLLFVAKKTIALYNTRTRKIDFIKKYNSAINFDEKIKADPEGNFWIFGSEGIYYLDIARLTLQKIENIPGDNNVNGMAFDNNSAFWMGKSGQGLIRYDKRKEYFHIFKVPALTQGVDSNGNYMLRSGNNFILFNPEEERLKQPNFLPAAFAKGFDPLRAIHCRGSDPFWFVSHENNCLAAFGGAGGAIKKYPLPYFENLWYKDIFKDNNGKHWLLGVEQQTRRRLFELDNDCKVVASYYFPVKTSAYEYSFISDFWQDNKGVFWFGTVHGLFSFNKTTGQWHHWENIPTNKASLSANTIFSLCPDPREPGKYLWLGTNGGGLDRFEFATGNCTHYTEKDGLPNSVVYGILDDEFGNLWLSTNRGLSCYDPNGSNDTTSRFRNFTEEDGLAGDEFNRYEFLKLKNGQLAFGGVNGLTIFRPSEVLKKGPAPNIVLTGLSVFNKPVSYKTAPDIIGKPIGYATSITLPYNKDMFTIEFVALDFSPEGKKHYRYFLEGFNKEWIDNGTQNTATFTNLNPGTYTFHVTGCNRDGVWNDKGTSITVVITPPWWATWWFRTIAIVAVSGAAYGFYRYRLYQAMKIQRLRNNIASDLHDKIGSTLSSISIASTIMQNKMKGTTPELSSLLQQISKNTDNMMEAMSDIVWAINTKNDHLDNLVNRMTSFAIEIMEPLNCTVHFNVDKNLDSVLLNMGQRKNVYLIFKEAINNIAKYAQCANVRIDISMPHSGRLTMKIKDDGKGFEQHSGENAPFNMGGNGLMNMQKRAAELRGKIELKSAPGQGTEVILEVAV